MKRSRKRISKVLQWSVAIGIIGVGIFFIALIVLAHNLPSVEQLDTRPLSQSTKIFDREGKVLLYEVSGGERRTVLPFDRIPQSLKDATVAVEDEKFYSEPAISWKAIARAVYTNLVQHRVAQGGSTITQQLAKNAFLSSEQTISRKLRELILAVQIDRHYNKDQILSFYLNEIPYGATTYGVESASELYFGKSATDLTLAESALIASLPRNPIYYSPWGNHVKDLIARQQFILKKMHTLGKITDAEFDAALKQPLSFQPQGSGIKAPHFVMAIQDYLVKKYGEDMVRTGGLKVTTTLDWNLEQTAERVVAEGAARNETLYKGKNAALVAEDPKTGQVLAMVGSRDYFDRKNDGNFNVATQGLRQPGSALKPFVYFTGFTKGFVPETKLFDVPTEFAANRADCPPTPDYTADNPHCFHPQNFDEKFRGPIDLRSALAQSVNIPAVKMLYLAGMKDVLRTLQNFGVTTLTDPSRYGLSLVLGGGEVRLIELTGAYATLAEDGVRHDQTLVLEVRDSKDTVLESYKDQAHQVADPDLVRTVNSILSDVDARAPLFGASLSLTTFGDHDVALKTGTSNDYHDAWSLGYTPSLVVGVWAGNNDNMPMQKHGSSILAAVPIWSAFMKEALQNAPTETFSRPQQSIPEKPALAGEYVINNEVHTILYYIDKTDPAGPPPGNPAADPQFVNWEFGVQSWAANNSGISGVASSTAQNFGGVQGAAPEINIGAPMTGSFASNPLLVQARLTGSSPIVSFSVYWNGVLLNTYSGNFGIAYAFSSEFPLTTIAPQNLLEIEAKTQTGQMSRSSVIVYGK